LQRLTTEVASLRDDMQVLTAIVLRHETMLWRLDEIMNGILQQITAMVAQNARTVDRHTPGTRNSGVARCRSATRILLRICQPLGLPAIALPVRARRRH
jgi:hypothetical protein